MAKLDLMYFKELPLDEEIEFSTNLSETNEIGEVFLKRSNKHLLTRLKIVYEPPSIDLENKDQVVNEKLEKYVLQSIKESNENKS